MKHVNEVAFCLFFMYLTNQPLVCLAQDDGFVMGAVDQVTSDPSTKVFKLSSGFVSSTINSFKEYSKINDGILENINKLSPKLAKAQELNNNYKESLLNLYGNDIVDDFSKMNDLQKKLDKTQGIIQNTTDEISLSKKEMYKLEAFLDEKLKTIEGTKFEKGLGAVGKGADYAGKFLDVLDVINSADTIFNDDVGKLEKVEASVSILSTTMSNFSKTFVKASGGGLVLFDTTMAFTELYLDGSRDVAQQLIDIMQKDIDQFYSLRRKVIANAVIANEGKSPKEIEDIANYEVGVLADQFMDRYSSNGQIYKSVFGHGITKLAAGSGHLTTNGSDIDTFNRCLNIFSENLISSEKNKTYITSRVGAVSSQLAEVRVAAILMEDELDIISDGLTSITNQKIKAVNDIKNIQKSNIAQKEAFQTTITQLENEFAQEQQTVANANSSAQLNSIDAKQNTNKQANSDNVQKEDVGSDIQSAEKLKQENLLLASKVENLLRQLNNPTLSQKQQNELNLELKNLSTKLNENAQAYLDLRKEIRKTDPTFGSLIDTVGTVTSRVGLELQNQLEEKEKEQQANRLAVEEKIKRINQANRDNKDELEALKNSISRMEQEKKEQTARTPHASGETDVRTKQQL